jgi:DNA-binding transcriptional LysR family regulator
MLKDFVKIETFLTVVRERSFSKASARLGISQPAVTQQIKFIEKYLDTKIIERKKNGIKLTSSGEELYKIAINLEKHINLAETDLLNIIDKKITFRLGASFTIGSYVVPGDCLNTMSEAIHNDIKLQLGVSKDIASMLKTKNIDLGLIETQILDDELISREWKEDELVIFSNVPIPKMLKPEDLYTFKWICREEGSGTRKIMAEVFNEIGVQCTSFDMLSEVSDTTAVLQTVQRSKKNKERPIVSVVSKYAIADKVQSGELFEARLQGFKMMRSFYIVYHKDNKHNVYVNNTVDHIMSGQC